MKWISNHNTQQVVKTYSHLIPEDFDPYIYRISHPDLIEAGIDDDQKAKEHYIIFGIQENRSYKNNQQPTSISDLIVYKPEIWDESSKNILYFSPNAPDYDSSSGGNRLLEILKIIQQDLQYNVWFMCNGYSSVKHIDAVKNLGIKVFVPDIKNKQYLDIYLHEAKLKSIKFSNAIFSWYDIAKQYLPMVKSIFPDIKTIIDSVDIHWLREQRGKDAKQLDIPQEILDLRKSIEKQTYLLADVIFTVTENDKYILQQEINYQRTVKTLSNIAPITYQALGNNMFFVGNYNHGPNNQAVLESIKIYENFQKTPTYKDLIIKPKLYIVGPNLDNKIKNSTQNENIVFYGHVEQLSTIYETTNLLIAPLYWGAGIKGKICDSGMSGIPILTTDIGNEGIGLTNRYNGLISNNINDFIDSLCYFYSLTQKEQLELGNNGREHLKKIVSKEAAQTILSTTLATKPIILSIVTYNQTEKLLKCINSILEKTTYTNYKIFISDNSNNNITQKAIKPYIKNYPNKILYTKNVTNDFFIKPNNRLFYNETYKNCDIVLINDDLEIITKEWLDLLYSAAYSNNNICAAGGKTIYPDGKLAEAGAELYIDGHGRNVGRYENPNDIKYNIPKYTGYCSGCLLYMRRDALEKLGGFSDKLEPMYYEDSEWQYRAHLYGLKTIYEPRCEAIHDEGSSSGTDITKGMKRYQEINRNKFIEIMRSLGCNDVSIYNE